MSKQAPIDRREALAITAAAAAATLLPGEASAQARKKAGAAAAPPPAPAAPQAGKRFFTAHEWATLDELAEAIIPADAQSGGAKAAGVTDVIDRRLGELVDPVQRQSWRDDLAEIDRLSLALLGRTFLKADAAGRRRLLERVSRNEGNPKEAGEFAFGTIKWEVAWAYYKSRVGIHDEMQYKGNVLLDEFVGTDIGNR